MNSKNKKTIESPCIKVCTIGEKGFCIGCYRTLDEIAAWPFLNDEEKEKILEKIERLKRLCE